MENFLSEVILSCDLNSFGSFFGDDFGAGVRITLKDLFDDFGHLAPGLIKDGAKSMRASPPHRIRYRNASNVRHVHVARELIK